MDNGSNNSSGRELARFTPNHMITPEEHTRRRVEASNRLLAEWNRIQEENNAALQNFFNYQQQLTEQAAAGKEAERRLSQINQSREYNNATLTANPAPISTYNPNVVASHNPTAYQQPVSQYANMYPTGQGYTQSTHTPHLTPTTPGWSQPTATANQSVPGSSSNPHYPYASYSGGAPHAYAPHPHAAATAYQNQAVSAAVSYQQHQSTLPVVSHDSGSSRAPQQTSFHASHAQQPSRPPASSIPQASSSTAPGPSNQDQSQRAPASVPAPQIPPIRAPEVSKSNSETTPQASTTAPTQLGPILDAADIQKIKEVCDEVIQELKPFRRDGVLMILQQVTKKLLYKIYPNSQATIPELPQNLDAKLKGDILKVTDIVSVKLKELSKDAIIRILHYIQHLANTSQTPNVLDISTTRGSITKAGGGSGATSQSTPVQQPTSVPNNSGTTPQASIATSAFINHTASQSHASTSSPQENQQQARSFRVNSELVFQQSHPSVPPPAQSSSTQAQVPVESVESDSDEVQEITIQDLPQSTMRQELSPSRANRSRLAHDIMRALGRPALFASRDSTPDNQGSVSGAQKRTGEETMDITAPLSPKRQRMSLALDMTPSQISTYQPSTVEIPIAEPQPKNVTRDISSTNPGVNDDPATTGSETHAPTATQTPDVDMYVEIKTAGAIQLEQEQFHHQQQAQYDEIPEPIGPADQHPFHQSATFDDTIVPLPPSSPPANSGASAPPASPSEASSHHVTREAEQVDRTPLAESDVNALHDDDNVVDIFDDVAPPPTSSQRSSPKHPSSASKAKPYVDIPVLSPFKEAKTVTASQLSGTHTSSPRKSSSSSVRSRGFRAGEPSLVITTSKGVGVVPSSVTPPVLSIPELEPEPEVEPEPRTPVRAGPSSSAPLFLPSPTSEDGEDGDAEVGLDSGEFILDQSLLRDASASGSRVSTRAKGKGKEKEKEKRVIDVEDSSEDEIQFLGKSPPKKHLVTPAKVRRDVRSKTVERIAYVLVPPTRVIKFMKRRRETGMTSSSEVSRDEVGGLGTSRQPSDPPSEQEGVAFELASNRFHMLQCEWKGCPAVLDCTNRMIAHVAMHAKESIEMGVFSCEWTNCVNRYIDGVSLEEHVASHAKKFMFCAKSGCLFQAFSKRALASHHAQEYHQKDGWKPSAEIQKLEPPKDLQPLPVTLPTFVCVEQKVAKYPIPRVMHLRLGAKVAANIVCYVQPGGRSNAARPSRTSWRVTKRIEAIEQAMSGDPEAMRSHLLQMPHDEYAPWDGERYRSRPKFCSDVPSEEVTELVRDGLVLFAGPVSGRTEGPEAPVEIQELGDGVSGGVGERAPWSVSSMSEGAGGVAVSKKDVEDRVDGIDSEEGDGGVRNVGGSWELVDPAGQRRPDGVPAVALHRDDGWTGDERGQVDSVSQGQSSAGPTDEDEGVVENLLWANNRQDETGPSLFRPRMG